MKLALLAVGRPRERFIQEGIDEYLPRIQRFVPVELVTVKASTKRGARAEAAAMAEEAARILGRLKPTDLVVALDREGRKMDSPGLARWLAGQADRGTPRVVFIVGSAPGLDPKVLVRANLRLSLSPLTLPHQMALLVAAEQVYRAWTIIRGVPYHR